MKKKNMLIIIFSYILFVLIKSNCFNYLYIENIKYDYNVLPFVLLNIFIPIITILLLSYFISKNNKGLSIISILVFILSSYSYISYSNFEILITLPLIFLSFIGIDIIKKKNNSLLLIVSLILIVLVNKNDLLSKIIPLFIYSLYKSRLNFKYIIRSIYQVLFPLLVSLFITSLYTIPNYLNDNYLFYSFSNINLIDKLFYNRVGLGLGIILILSILNNFRYKNDLLLNIFLILGIILPINVIYLMPLYILVIDKYLNDFNINKFGIIISLLLFLYTGKIMILLDLYFILLCIYCIKKLGSKFIYILLIPLLFNCYYINKDIYLITYSEYKYNYDIINYLSKDIDDVYINLNDNISLIDLISNDKKYVVSRKNLSNYELIRIKNGIGLYYNKNTLPLYYASSNLITYDYFKKLDRSHKEEALLYYVINNDVNTKYISHLQVGSSLYNYKLNNYYLNYGYLDNFNIYKFNINKELSSNSNIVGSIDNDKDCYFIIKKDYKNIYDIKIDNQIIDYELVNNKYIGFYLKKGFHDIGISFKEEIVILIIFLNVIGIMSLFFILLLEFRRKI